MIITIQSNNDGDTSECRTTLTIGWLQFQIGNTLFTGRAILFYPLFIYVYYTNTYRAPYLEMSSKRFTMATVWRYSLLPSRPTALKPSCTILNTCKSRQGTNIVTYSVSIHWSFSWKLVRTVTQRVTIQSVNFLMLLFGNERLTSLVYINIRHKLTWWQPELG